MKKITIYILFLVSLFAFTGCFDSLKGNGTTTVTEELNEKTYETSDFSIKIPRDWEIIERADMRSDIPPEVRVMFLNNVKDPFYTASIVITSQALDTEYNNLDFAKLMIDKHKDTVNDFAELSRESINLENSKGESVESMLFKFQGRETYDSDLINVQETYFVDSKTVYTITSGYAPYEDAGVIVKLTDALKSFQIK